MKIKISKSQWEKIGKEAGYIKTSSSSAEYEDKIKQLYKEITIGPEYKISSEEQKASFKLGSLFAIFANALSDIEKATIPNIVPSSYISSTSQKLGVQELVEKIQELKKTKRNQYEN